MTGAQPIIPHIGFPEMTFAHLEAELAREIEARRGFYPGRVEKGNMLQAEADRELALAAAWLEDAGRMRSLWTAPAAAPERVKGLPAPVHGFSWRDRRAALLRELELRARLYPEWVAGGRLLAHQAAHRLACLGCLLAIYEDGWDWLAANGRRGNVALAVRDPLEREACAEYLAVRAEIDAREGRSQKELELA